MNDAKYIGVDVHQATISVAVRNSRGNLVMEAILETKAETILQFIGGLRGSLYVAFEEGTWAAWLHDLLQPHVARVLASDPRKNALLKDGNKSDRIDARKLAELLYLNKLSPVYHGETGMRMLRELARSYLTIVKDTARVESVKSGLSQLSDPLCRTRGLLPPPSRRVAGKDHRSRRPPPNRTTLTATGHAATPLSASSARTVDGESKTSHTAALRQIPSLGPIKRWSN